MEEGFQKNITRLFKKTTFFIILFLSLLTNAIYSRPSTLPGMFIGIPIGKPFPSGLYLFNMPAYIAIPSSSIAPSTNIAVNASTLAYVHDSKFLKGTPFLVGAVSEAFYRDGAGHAWVGNIYNPDFFLGMEWLLTPNLGFSNLLGGYVPMNTQGLSTDAFVFNERAVLTYFNDDSEATIHFVYGLPQASMTPFKPSLPNYINLDLTYVYLFNKLSLGPIAFGSWDINKEEPWSQFAVGGIVGYDFGAFSLQFWLAKDTNANHWGNAAVSGFLRVIVPLENKTKVNLSKSLKI